MGQILFILTFLAGSLSSDCGCLTPSNFKRRFHRNEQVQLLINLLSSEMDLNSQGFRIFARNMDIDSDRDDSCVDTHL